MGSGSVDSGLKDDVVVLMSSCRRLQLSVERFRAETEAVGMTNSKSDAMVLSQKSIDCPLWVGSKF